MNNNLEIQKQKFMTSWPFRNSLLTRNFEKKIERQKQRNGPIDFRVVPLGEISLMELMIGRKKIRKKRQTVFSKSIGWAGSRAIFSQTAIGELSHGWHADTVVTS
jgi:hypothetical protein